MTRIIPFTETTDPSAVPNNAVVYSKDVAGVTRLFVRLSDGTILELGASAVPGTSPLPEQWTRLGLAASLDEQMSALVSTNFDSVLPTRASSITGLRARLSAPFDAGTVTVAVSVNGVAGTLQLTFTAGQTAAYVTQPADVDTYNVSSLIGARVITSNDFSVTGTCDVEAWIEVATVNGGSTGGGGSGGSPLAIYGDGSFGNYTTTGDETWDSTNGAPGAPSVPAGSTIPFAFFNNLTIGPGDSVAVGSFTDAAVVIFVKDTLTIGAGARIHVNGQDGSNGTVFGGAGGSGRKAIEGGFDGAAGAQGTSGAFGGPGYIGFVGQGTAFVPGRLSSTRVGGTGGTSGPWSVQPAHAGGVGGAPAAPASWPYSLAQAINVASLLYQIGGGCGGGSGGASGSSGFGGAGGGGAGTLVIFAKNIVAADPGCLQAKGGKGGNGWSSENIPGGGGGGGTGGTILIVTENTSLAGVCDVSGGAGGFGDGFPADPGTAGGAGEAIAFNPTLAAQIPT